jgi:hypothetical protein
LQVARVTDVLLRSEGEPGIAREDEGTSGNNGESGRK